MEALKKQLSADLVSKINGVYAFNITDANKSEWFLDLKTGSGRLEPGQYNGKSDCQMTMTSDVFNRMISGKLKPTAAFMSGKLKIKGNMGLAMKLEKLMTSMQAKL